MRRWSLPALLASAFLLILAPFSVRAGALESAVWIDVERGEGILFNGHPLPRQGEGMGAILSPYEIATAAHVVSGARSIVVSTTYGTTLKAKVVRVDNSVDAAVLRVDVPLKHPIRIRPNTAVTGEVVSALGLRLSSGASPTLYSGVVGASKWTSNGVAVPIHFLHVKGEKGMSGGGVFDQSGLLVGIVIRIDGRLGYLSALPIADFCARLGCGR